MSLYAEYILEKEGRQVLERPEGFASYAFVDKPKGLRYCYIVDIYVKKEFRNKKIASDMASEIAKIAADEGCCALLGSIDPNSLTATNACKALLAYGFDIMGFKEKLIWFIKELE